MLFVAVAGAATIAAPLQAQASQSQMTVGIQDPPPARSWQWQPQFPFPPGYWEYWRHRNGAAGAREPRCEQDRLLTDTRPCDDRRQEAQ